MFNLRKVLKWIKSRLRKGRKEKLLLDREVLKKKNQPQKKKTDP